MENVADGSLGGTSYLDAFGFVASDIAGNTLSGSSVLVVNNTAPSLTVTSPI